MSDEFPAGRGAGQPTAGGDRSRKGLLIAGLVIGLAGAGLGYVLRGWKGGLPQAHDAGVAAPLPAVAREPSPAEAESRLASPQDSGPNQLVAHSRNVAVMEPEPAGNPAEGGAFTSSDPIPSAVRALRDQRINPTGLKVSKSDLQAMGELVRRINAEHGALRGELHTALKAHCRSLAESGQAVPVPRGERFEAEGAGAMAVTHVNGQRYGVRLDIQSIPELAAIDAESDRVLSAGIEELAAFVAAHGFRP